MRFLSLVALLPSFLSTSALVVPHPTPLSMTTFDYIIVGGGTAGNVVANRLSEDGKYTVLVLEAGADASKNINAQVPMLCTGLSPNTPLDWNYTTVAQPGLNGRSLPYSRGYALGGSSAINYMIYNRGSRDDWDSYARISNDQSLSWNAMSSYLSKVENFTLPHTPRNVTGEYSPAAHSNTGMLSVTLPSLSVSLDGPVIAATQELAAEFPYQQDQNAGNPIGVGWAQSTVSSGARSSSNSAYIQNFLSRPNLYVHTGAQVTRLLETGTSRGTPVMLGVEFAASASATRFKATARKEVILAAGAFNTPQLLMLSGIGNTPDLMNLGIRPLANLPSVGQNMTDHALLANKFKVKANDTIQAWLAPTAIKSELDQWMKDQTGVLSDSGHRQTAWLRLPKNDTIFKSYADPTAGPTSAHYEFIFLHGLYPGQQMTSTDNYINIVTNVISPVSRGSVTLASNDSFAHPLINPNLLGSDFDKHVMTYALRAALRYASAKAFNGYLDTTGAFGGATTDAQLAKYAAQNIQTGSHSTGTAAVSPHNAAWGVLNPDLTVKKVVGLSVVDGSGIPYVPSAHTQGVIYLWAERAADQIKARA